MKLAFYLAVSVAAAWRVFQAARAPRDVPLRAVAVCLLCVWGIYVVAVPGDAGTLAVLAGHSSPEHRVARVVQHLLVVVCGYALMCFYLYAAPTTGARRRVRREGMALAGVVTALVVIAISAPDGVLTRSYAAADMAVPQVFGFYGLTALYMGYVMGATCGWTCRVARTSWRPYAVGLWVAGSGLGAMALACGMHAAAMCVRALGGSASWTPVANFLIVAAVVTFVTGFSYPAVRIRGAAVLLWCRRHRAYRRLEPLWRLLTQAYPDLVFAPSPRARYGRGVHRGLHRRMIECRDGLVRISPRLETPGPASVLQDLPPEVLAQRLREACASRVTGGAADHPPLYLAARCGQDREGDLRELLDLADALRGRVPHQGSPRSGPTPRVRSGHD